LEENKDQDDDSKSEEEK
jgi:hypothetical protein